ncbi:clan AA aspartic protease [Candidatus Halobeggiatoa sp. HSG11]|nr:clan AA aspartic protease [Candidatus Halobeggiatoa sp. HSG11]
MGIINTDLQLSNPAQPNLNSIKVTAIVDTGAITLCIPEHIAIQLKLEETEQREVTTADSKSHLVPYAGPIKINYLGRTCYTGALVLGDTVLMGAIPLEDMDLVISPRDNTVTVNPNSPNIPAVIVK